MTYDPSRTELLLLHHSIMMEEQMIKDREQIIMQRSRGSTASIQVRSFSGPSSLATNTLTQEN